MELKTKHVLSPTGIFHTEWWQHLWASLPALRLRRAPRQLRLCESVSLGEKRLIAVIQYQNQCFLIGAGSQSVNLLSRLDTPADFSQQLTEWCERQR